MKNISTCIWMHVHNTCTSTYFGRMKEDTLKNLMVFKEFVETQSCNKLKAFHSDNGGEYVNKSFKEFCTKNGIIMETTAPYSPSQNGIAEWLNQTLLEHVHAMLFANNLPKICYGPFSPVQFPIHLRFNSILRLRFLISSIITPLVSFLLHPPYDISDIPDPESPY